MIQAARVLLFVTILAAAVAWGFAFEVIFAQRCAPGDPGIEVGGMLMAGCR